MKFLSARKGFYKELFVLVMPIVVQNLIDAGAIIIGKSNMSELAFSFFC